jgi:hypothetical protein
MRRILFLDHPEPTFGSSFLWHGLKELERKSQGSIEMTLYPYLPTHFEAERFDLRELPWYWWLADLVRKSKYGGEPLSYGIPQFGMNENLTYTGKVNDIAFSTPRLRFPETNIIYDEDHIVSEMQQRPFDLIVLGNSHRVPTILLSRLKERMRKLPPIIYLDAGERDELNEHWVHVFRPAVIFKEHLTPAVEARGLTVKIPNYKFKIYPLPLSQPIANHASLVDTGGTNLGALQTISTVMKERQVFYWLGPTWPLRKKALDVLDALMKRKGEAVSSVEDYPEYHRMLALSRMGVSMRGSGRDTTRYWEVPLYRTVLVADGTMGCIHPHAFEERALLQDAPGARRDRRAQHVGLSSPGRPGTHRTGRPGASEEVSLVAGSCDLLPGADPGERRHPGRRHPGYAPKSEGRSWVGRPDPLAQPGKQLRRRVKSLISLYFTV